MAKERTTLADVLEAGVLPKPASGERVYWDHDVIGLGLRLRARGPTTWIAQWRTDGRVVKRTLGRFEDMSLTEARTAANGLIAVPTTTPTVSSLAAFAEVFLRDCAGRWKPATQEGHRYNLRTHVIPILGDKPINAVTRADVIAWRAVTSATGRSQDRVLSVMSSMMRHAEALGLRPAGSNPCAGLRRHRSDFEARYLTGDEFRRLGAALDHFAPTHPAEVTLIWFLMLTGARKGEALALEWSTIQGPRAILPDSKTGPKTIWLADPLRRFLTGLLRSETSPFVFTRPDGRIMEYALDRAWKQVRAHAGLQGLRLHDLRHNYASVAVSTGEELRTAASLLGHAQVTTTMGYAHLAEAPIFAAADRVAGQLAEALVPAEPVDPIQPIPSFPKRPTRSQRRGRRRRPKPNLDALSPAERRWEPHIQAFREGHLKLIDFCHLHGLDPQEMRRFLGRHHQRAKRQSLAARGDFA